MSAPATISLRFDIAQTPFSRMGSYLSVFRTKGDPGCGEGLYLRTHHAGRLGRRDVLRLELLVDGQSVPFTVEASPAVLVLRGGAAQVRLCFASQDRLRVEGTGAGLRLRAIPGEGNVAQPMAPRRWSINARRSYCRIMTEVRVGQLQADCPWEPRGTPPMTLSLLPEMGGRLEAALDWYWSSWIEPEWKPFAECVQAVEREWAGWLAQQPSAPLSLRAAWELAAYVTWASVIKPGGLLKRPAMLMSKVQMDNVWSWDHCFNAMALAAHAPELAFDQWWLPFDLQDPFGALADAFNPYVLHFNFCKPPVQGWALQYLMARQPAFYSKTRLRQVFGPLEAWTNWWLTQRRQPGAALPYYLHGNDSGWDNSTMFDAGAPLAAPDLAAFLVIQSAVLADLATRLGKTQAARHWQTQAGQLRDALLAELWRGDGFVARRLSDGAEVRSASLVPLMPILLGQRLPKPVARQLVAALQAHLTDWGLATELTDSPQYTSDGYWRGPIWAPCTLIAVNGLEAVGQKKLAREIAARFCRLCAQSGMAENFDALSGAALRDTAYTWTASTFLVLAHDYLRGSK